MLMTAGFGVSIRSLASDHLRVIQLEINHRSMLNENSPVHKFVDDGQWSQETWFRMFNHLASFPNLAVLRLLGGLVICPEFFRSIINHTKTPFPSLLEFELQFAAETADGRWYYERDDEAIEYSRHDPQYEYFWEEMEDDIDYEENWTGSTESLTLTQKVKVWGDGPYRTGVVLEDRFRSVPSTITFLPFLMDASQIVSCIPTLRKFILKLGNQDAKHSDLDYYPIVSRVFELWYLKAGTRRWLSSTPTSPYVIIPGDSTYLNQNRLYWRVDRWEPWEQVQAAWGAVAGRDAKIVFLDEDRWSSDGYTYEGEF
jgi:hypothetical protein